jgi:hypothetical protein
MRPRQPLPCTDNRKRLRFKLSPEQGEIAAPLLEIEGALAAAGMDKAWLKRKDRQPGAGRWF